MWVFTEVDDGLPRKSPGQDEDDSGFFGLQKNSSGIFRLLQGHYDAQDMIDIGHFDEKPNDADAWSSDHVAYEAWDPFGIPAPKKKASPPKDDGVKRPYHVIRREHDHHNSVKEPEDEFVRAYATYAEAREVASTWISSQWGVHVDEREKGTICGGYETYATFLEGEEMWIFVQEEGTRRLGGPDGTVAPESVFVVVERRGASESASGSKVDIVEMKVFYA
ncbi:uncharacterized protein LOC62_03G004951 [Vanrija pseudolonga]|uniref:Uncharacterized protein n=1 Tax=Vanrija pseudolonga TaxID=143232 RepID=A0AAF0YDC9_9TREE|nr:hypothetical protein LOC62_03G004951 [Vanrija pseudolonga]